MEGNEFRRQRAKAVMNEEVKQYLQFLIDSSNPPTFEECRQLLVEQMENEMEELIKIGTATLPNKCLTFHRYGLGLRWLEARVGYLRKEQQ